MGHLYPGCRFALPWAKCLLPFQGVYFAGLSSRTGVYPCLSPCDGCKNPAGVMMWVAENVQACLRIFRRAQHQWLVRDILHPSQGVFYVFVLLPPQEYTDEKPILWRTALQAAFVVCYLYPRALPPVTHGSAFQAPECLWDSFFYHGFNG